MMQEGGEFSVEDQGLLGIYGWSLLAWGAVLGVQLYGVHEAQRNGGRVHPVRDFAGAAPLTLRPARAQP